MLNIGAIKVLGHRRLIDSLSLCSWRFLRRDRMDRSLWRRIIVAHAWRQLTLTRARWPTAAAAVLFLRTPGAASIFTGAAVVLSRAIIMVGRMPPLFSMAATWFTRP